MPHGCGKRTLLVKRKNILEPFELQPGVAEVGGVGIGEMAVNPLHLDPKPAAEGGFLQGCRAVVMDADPLHPGVDLQMDFGRPAQGPGGGGDLIEPADRRCRQRQSMADILRDLVAPNSPQDENRRRDPFLAQKNAFFENGHADVIGAGRQITGHFGQAMAVGVGLDHGQDLGWGGQGLEPIEVPADPGQVDFDPG